MTTASIPAPLPRIMLDVTHPPIQQPALSYTTMHAPAYTTAYGPSGLSQYASASSHYPPPMSVYPAQLPPISGPDPRLPAPLTIPNATGPNNKRLAPHQPHPAESPAKKKQSKWSADEDALIIELRGQNMKWEDISKRLPGRSAISCRLRFQNYLERRSEWDEEKKNKLARLYERFKKDMWEKIAKEMQMPWRAAEAMHWQIGEVEMAQRANVPVFHLAGQQASQASSEGGSNTSPSSVLGIATNMSAFPPHTHAHSLSALQQTSIHLASPDQPRLPRRNSIGSSPSSRQLGGRSRADSARAVPAASSLLLPPVEELTGPASSIPERFPLPPVGVLSDSLRRPG